MKIISRVNKLKCTYTTKEIYIRLILKLYETIYHMMRSVFTAVKPVDISTKLFFGFRPDICFLFSIKDKSRYKEHVSVCGRWKDIIEQADRICAHKFDLLGSGELYLGERINWNCDFKTGFIWPRRYYKNIRIIDFSNDADVKVPWELSRFQHIFSLGKAYWLTDNEKYSKEFRNQIEHWTEENPIEMTVNWTCTMDVAIRAVNLIAGYYLFMESGVMDERFWGIFNKMLYLHGKFIYRNLENKSKHTGNHYLADIAALIWLGLYFRHHGIGKGQNRPRTWLCYGLKEFEKEMAAQVNDDGTNYEASTSYHRLVTEIFLVTTILCAKNDIRFCREFMQRLEKMCDFIADITKPNGMAPMIGDADDGRFIIFSDYPHWERRDFRHILAVAGDYFDRSDFRHLGKKNAEDAFWTAGFYYTLKAAKESVTPELNSIAYRNGGYYILRNSRVYCIIRCGELSLRGRGGHSHNDQLSLELSIDGEDVLVDPGTYAYTADPSMRNLFRSTAVHSTLHVCGFEQNNFCEHDLFHMQEQTFGECLEFTDTKFTGRHYGYREKCGVIHERTVELQPDGIIVTDSMAADAGGTFDANVFFVIDAGCKVNKRERDMLIVCKDRKFVINGDSILDTEIEDVLLAPGYGKLTKSIKINIPVLNKYSSIDIKACRRKT